MEADLGHDTALMGHRAAEADQFSWPVALGTLRRWHLNHTSGP